MYEKTVIKATETFEREKESITKTLEQRLEQIEQQLIPLKKAADEANVIMRALKQNEYEKAVKKAELDRALARQTFSEKLEYAEKLLKDKLEQAETQWENEKLRVTRAWNDYQLSVFSPHTSASTVNISINVGS